MSLTLPDLPFTATALAPHLSEAAVQQHHDVHLRGHLARLNARIAGTPLAGLPLVEIVRQGQGAVAAHAAQVWAGSFYFEALRSPGGPEPTGRMRASIETTFTSTATLRDAFNAAALGLKGEGWAWLVQRTDGRLGVAATACSATPLTGTDRPLLACSLWQDAYATDYANQPGAYLEAFWALVDWKKVASRLA